MFQLILSGLALGCIYSLVALGYHITFMTSRTLNFAQGSAMMLGAVAAADPDRRLRLADTARHAVRNLAARHFRPAT